jgi:miniconductance mechanosensitive channel
MEESGVRRICRSINIDINSVHFCTAEELKKFAKIHRIKDYIATTELELTQFNAEQKIDNSVLVNGKRQTNLGVFRNYLTAYLQNNPDISSEMTLMVRQLEPGMNGIPLQIYVFSKVQAWIEYERIQSDIFDHVLAVIPEFNLRAFQNPTGSDFSKLK